MTIGKNKAEFSISANILKNIDNIHVSFEVFVFPTNIKDKRKLIDMNLDWCTYIDKPKTDFLSKVMFSPLADEKNHWMLKCPIEKVSVLAY